MDLLSICMFYGVHKDTLTSLYCGSVDSSTSVHNVSLLRGLDGSTITEIGCCRLITCTH